MEDNHHHHLLQPLIHQSTAAVTVIPPPDASDNPNLVPSNSTILLRLSLVALIGIVSAWANHEASKGHAVTVLNESRNTFPGKRFQLFYVSNDEATRLVVRTSRIVESFLYPDSDGRDKKKPVKRIVLKLTDRNLTDDGITIIDRDEFVLSVNSSIMEGTDFDETMVATVGRGVARIWLWDGQGNAPKSLIDGIVEFILTDRIGGRQAGTAEPPDSAAACWKHAGYLRYCERRRPGFIRRLNGAMKDEWDDRMLDGALGLPVHGLCTAYRESLRYNHISSM